MAPMRTEWERDGEVDVAFGCGGVARGAARSFVAETAAGPIAMAPPADLLGEVVDRVPLVDAVVLADAVLARHELMAKDMLSEWSTNPRLRQVARLADGRAESPMETPASVVRAGGLADAGAAALGTHRGSEPALRPRISAMAPRTRTVWGRRDAASSHSA
ncbi:hypothetical protein J4Z35_12970 [Dermacoccus sp. NHGro5]|nr:hypothetical protein [Dermacoccus sp. NHGro5]